MSAQPRNDRCPICGQPMSTERGYRCFECTALLAEEKRQAGSKKGETR